MHEACRSELLLTVRRKLETVRAGRCSIQVDIMSQLLYHHHSNYCGMQTAVYVRYLSENVESVNFNPSTDTGIRIQKINVSTATGYSLIKRILTMVFE